MNILSYEKVQELVEKLNHDKGLLEASYSNGIEEARDRCKTALGAIANYEALFSQVEQYRKMAEKAEKDAKEKITQAKTRFNKELSSYVSSAKTLVQDMENARKRH